MSVKFFLFFAKLLRITPTIRVVVFEDSKTISVHHAKLPLH
jgi:hypothetical protein